MERDTLIGSFEQLSDRVYTILSRRVIQRQLTPGQHLVVDQLAKELGTSITPVRAALDHLTQEGLLTHVPYQGWKVRVFKRTEITELYQVRAALESFAIELCCERIDSDELEVLTECQEKGEAHLIQRDLGQYQTYNDDFHDFIVRVAGNQTLSKMMAGVRNQVRLFSGQTIQVPGRPQVAVKEHAEMVSAIRTADIEHSGRLMRQHILTALADVLKYALTELDESGWMSCHA